MYGFKKLAGSDTQRDVQPEKCVCFFTRPGSAVVFCLFFSFLLALIICHSPTEKHVFSSFISGFDKTH